MSDIRLFQLKSQTANELQGDASDLEKTLQNLQNHTTVIGNPGDETEPFIIKNF